VPSSFRLGALRERSPASGSGETGTMDPGRPVQELSEDVCDAHDTEILLKGEDLFNPRGARAFDPGRRLP